MRLLSLASLCLTLAACGPVTAQENPAEVSQIPTISQERSVNVPVAVTPLVAAARERLKANVRYDGRYIGLDYPGGDVPANIGVCTDVVIRALRKALCARPATARP